MPSASGAVFPRAITISRNDHFKFSPFFSSISSGLSSERIILSPFTKEFRGEGHSYESLNFSGATVVATSFYHYEKQFKYAYLYCIILINLFIIWAVNQQRLLCAIRFFITNRFVVTYCFHFRRCCEFWLNC